jgi:hypothetical protein
MAAAAMQQANVPEDLVERYTGLKNVNGMVCTDVSWHYKTGTVWTGPGPWPPAGMNPDISTWLNEPTSPEKAKKDMELWILMLSKEGELSTVTNYAFSAYQYPDGACFKGHKSPYNEEWIPERWCLVGIDFTKEQVEGYCEKNWVDMTPKTTREQMRKDGHPKYASMSEEDFQRLAYRQPKAEFMAWWKKKKADEAKEKEAKEAEEKRIAEMEARAEEEEQEAYRRSAARSSGRPQEEV